MFEFNLMFSVQVLLHKLLIYQVFYIFLSLSWLQYFRTIHVCLKGGRVTVFFNLYYCLIQIKRFSKCIQMYAVLSFTNSWNTSLIVMQQLSRYATIGTLIVTLGINLCHQCHILNTLINCRSNYTMFGSSILRTLQESKIIIQQTVLQLKRGTRVIKLDI